MRKITISLPDNIAEKANRAVSAGQASSVSSWFAELARREPDWSAAEAILAELVEQAGASNDDWEWAESVFDTQKETAADDAA